MSRYVSLRAKLILLTFSLLIGFSLVVVVYLQSQFAAQLSSELLKRGVSIARHLSTLSANAFIEGDNLYLDYLAREHRRVEDDISYIFMLGPNQEVLAHSFAERYPEELPKVNPLPAGEPWSLVSVDLGTDELIYDIAVPVLDGRPGSVHLGVSATAMRQAVNTLILKILGAIALTGLVALGIAVVASQQIARPVHALTRAVQALGRGERCLQLPVAGNDEVGQLTTAFRGMVDNLSRAEQRLVLQKQFLERLLDDIPVPVFYKDQHGRMLGCNRAFADFWGYAREDLIGREATELYAIEQAGLHVAKDEEVLRYQRLVIYELPVRNAAGERRTIIFHKALFVDPDSALTGIVGVMLDVTTDRQAETFRREFVSTVAHEFQTPLATIIGFADILQQLSLDEQTAREALQAILTKAEGLSVMVDELLDLGRVESGRPIRIAPHPVELAPILRQALDSFRTGCHSHRLDITLADPPLEIVVDPERIVQVVDNLLSNAVKYSPPGTLIEFTATKGADGLRLMVTDQGIGLSEDESSRLFEKFYRADTSNTAPAGTGLGLYICKAIVDAHGGTIRVDSAPGQGTRVQVDLPWRANRLSSASQSVESATAGPGGVLPSSP
ncbi:MAG: ATP-binding protein [Desulfuromonadales bacterium]|nr:ATP-binding protein [Desulfuromonadales bacterium]